MTINVSPLFEPFTLGATMLRNRVLLAPMTRVSANPDGTVTDRMHEYYRIFAAGGFSALITEGLYIDTEHSPGYPNQPGIAVGAHVESWRGVTDAAHAEGAAMIAQLMHAGPQVQGNPFGYGPVGPSDQPAAGLQLTMYGGQGPYPDPEALDAAGINRIIEAHINSALRARDAGFDGVEIHGANGYLIDSFLTDYLNVRTDSYGGSPANRARLAVEVSSAVRDTVGPDFVVGIRISQAKVSNPRHKWAGHAGEAAAIFDALNGIGLDYVHTSEFHANEPAFRDDPRSLADFAREHVGVPVIANGNINTAREAVDLVGGGHSDLVAIGKPALATRNWPARVEANLPVHAPFDVSTLGSLADVKSWETDADSLLELHDARHAQETQSCD